MRRILTFALTLAILSSTVGNPTAPIQVRYFVAQAPANNVTQNTTNQTGQSGIDTGIASAIMLAILLAALAIMYVIYLNLNPEIFSPSTAPATPPPTFEHRRVEALGARPRWRKGPFGQSPSASE